MTILLLERLHADAEALLAAHDTLLAPAALDEAHRLAGVTAILTRGKGRVTAALLEGCPALRVVARCGVGLDNIDLAAAQARGVTVVYAPGSTTTAVAEHTVLLLLAASRRLHQLATAVDGGNWAVRDGYVATELAGKTLGIVGLGAIGRRVATIAQALGMRVVAASRSSQAAGIAALPLDALLGESDAVSLHVALTPETRGLLGERELALMRPGSLLLNTARGALIDQTALLTALDAGRPGYFASDVLATEPPEAGEPLLGHPHVLLTPHTAALTDATYRAMCVSTATNVLTVLRGEQPEPHSIYHSR